MLTTAARHNRRDYRRIHGVDSGALLVALLVSLAVALSACGSPDADNSAPSSPPSWSPPDTEAPQELSLSEHATYTVHVDQLIHFAVLPKLDSTFVIGPKSPLTYYGSTRTLRPLRKGKATLTVETMGRDAKCLPFQPCGGEWHLTVNIKKANKPDSPLPPEAAPITTPPSGGEFNLRVGQWAKVSGSEDCTKSRCTAVAPTTNANGTWVVGIFPGATSLTRHSTKYGSPGDTVVVTE